MESIDDALVQRVADLVEARLRASPVDRAYYTFEQAGELMHISHRTLRNLHFRKVGPKPTYVGRLVRFHANDLSAWLAEHRAKKTKKGAA
jgi:hypothetical protein